MKKPKQGYASKVHFPIASSLLRVLLLSIGAAAGSKSALALELGTTAPETAKLSVPSGSKTLGSLKGKVVMINFWATWCESCKIELKEMEQAFAVFEKNPAAEMLFVSTDKDGAKARAWVQGNLKTPNFVLDRLMIDSDFEFAELLNVDSFPMTFVLDSTGKVAYVARGFKVGEKSTEKISGLMQQLLDSKSATLSK